MKPLSFVLVAPLLLAGPAIASDVRYNFDADADFTQFRTYRWTMRGREATQELYDKQIRTAFEAELAKKGLSLAEGTRPDVFITYHFAGSREVQVTGTGGGRVVGPRGRVRVARPRTVSRSVERVGTLAFDMYTRGKHQVWHSVAERKIEFKDNPEKQAKHIANVVKQMLRNYPPKK